MTENTDQIQDQYGNQPADNLPRKGLVDRVKGLLTNAKNEWPIIGAESPDTGSLVTGYAIPLVLLSAIASFIGSAWIFHSAMVGVSFAIGSAVVGIFVMIIGIFLSAAIISALAPTFDSRKDFSRAVQLVIYASTPTWVLGILNIIPFLSWLWGLIGFAFAIYLFYLGLPHVMKTPENKVVGYMVVSAIVIILVYIVLIFIIGAIIFSIFGLGMASMGAFG